MSRAFVREDDQAGDALPDRVQSEHPNWVTPRGLALLEARQRELEQALAEAREAQDKDLAARIARDLRYCTARRGSARVIQVQGVPDRVRFGVAVVLGLAHGEERELRLVGEDEADPSAGLISWVAPLAQALLGRAVGDDVRFLEQDAVILALRP